MTPGMTLWEIAGPSLRNESRRRRRGLLHAYLVHAGHRAGAAAGGAETGASVVQDRATLAPWGRPDTTVPDGTRGAKYVCRPPAAR